MTREFGVRSYKPEDVNFSCSCDSFGEFGQPWTILNHKIYKNIFLEAYGNPSTAEELSLELGVALPYMEEELQYLTDQTLLTKDGNKYETAFPILSKHAQEKMWAYNESLIVPITSLFIKLIDTFTKACEAHGISYYGTYSSYEDAKWTILMSAFDSFVFSASPEGYWNRGYTKRPDGGCWDIVGYQNADIPDIPWVGLHGSRNERPDRPAVRFKQYKFRRDYISEKTPSHLTHDEALTLKAVAEGKWSACEPYWLERLLSYGYIKKTDTGYEPTVVVFDGRSKEEYLSLFTEEERALLTKIASKLRKLLREAIDYARKAITMDLPKSIANNEHLSIFACKENLYERRYVLEQALKDGWLVYDEHTSPVIGAFLYL